MNKTILKNDASLVGKLLAVEIEYLPTPGGNDVSTTAPGGSEALLTVVNDGTPNRTGVIKEIRLLTLVNNEGRLADLLGLDIKGSVNVNCGLHVHVDARHLGKNGRLTAEETYDRLTNNETRGGRTIRYCFKKLVPKSRHNNRYCKWKANRVGYHEKYHAFNWKSMAEHGTIEFRMAAGSINKHKIETWALLCQHVLDYASKPENEMPATWVQFLKILTPFLRDWVIFREAELAGRLNLSTRLMASLVGGINE